MLKAPRIMIVDDEEGIRFTLGTLFKKDGYQIETAEGSKEALAFMAEKPFDLVFSDIRLKNENGIDLLHDIKLAYPATQVVMFTGRPELETATRAIREGAFDYITKPIKYEHLIAVTKLALKSKKIRDMEAAHISDLDAIFKSISDAVIMVDAKGKLQHFNEAATDMCGYCIDMVTNKIEFGCDGICRATILKTLEDAKTCFVKRMECQNKDSNRKIVTLTVTPVFNSSQSVRGAVAVIRDETRLVQLEHSLSKQGDFYGIIGQNRAMLRLYNLIELLADMPSTVLITGESGTGKELVASALHHAGSRNNGPFIKVNCSALPETLLENELFGHVKGAFTGALDDKKGRFERADGGTIFLDEIGDISPAIQMRLLRVLQEFVVERVGDSTPIKIDVRVVTATNQNLEEKVALGSFRQDLYYRLNVVKIVLPPLRERTEDIPRLSEHFLQQFCSHFGRNISGFDDLVMERFLSHNWQGNVRELEHIIEHACILCSGNLITIEHLPKDFTAKETFFIEPAELDNQSMTLEQALKVCNGNKSKAAKMMGISRRTVYRQLG